MPSHNHQWMSKGNPPPATLDLPGPQSVFGRSTAGLAYADAPADPAAGVQMAWQTVGAAGGGQEHNNMMPYLAVTFCIALQGIFPSRS